MAYIRDVSEEEKLDPLQGRVFDAARRRFTFVPDIVRVLAIRPEVAYAQGELRDSLLGRASTIGERRADLISLAVSGINGCKYCGTAHAGMMVARGEFTQAEAAAIFKDWRSLDLESGDQEMLEFAEKLTFDPASITEPDIQRLRKAGFDDVGIYDIVLITAY